VAARLIKDGKADGLVSAGNTGAVFMICKFLVGALKSVERPALAAILPTMTSEKSIMLDVGANVDCKPAHLKEFAVMGSFYAQEIMGKKNPRIGLLSIGKEEGKGNEFTRDVFKILKKTNLNFVGNVEGKNIFDGTVDVIVCDGFVGNLVLKSCESLAELVRHSFKNELSNNIPGKLGGFLLRRKFSHILKQLDYSEYGGAPLLGIQTNCVVCHGRSNANAIKNAIRVARECYLNKVNQRIEEKLEELSHADGSATRKER
jgi:glycerol-3-phosphate acyltransferase PlsX